MSSQAAAAIKRQDVGQLDVLMSDSFSVQLRYTGRDMMQCPQHPSKVKAATGVC